MQQFPHNLEFQQQSASASVSKSKKQYPQTVNRSTSSVSKLSSLHTYSQHLQCPRPKTYNIKFGALFAPKALGTFRRFSIRLP